MTCVLAGNQVRLAISLADGDMAWVGVYAAAIGLYMLGVAAGIGYLHIDSLAARWSLVLLLACVLVLIDVVLVEVIPDADLALRGLLAACSALPLGAQYAITKQRLGMPTSAMTGNLVRVVDMSLNGTGAWWRTGGLGRNLTHEGMLLLAVPVLFTIGALGGVEIEKHVQYALSVIAPFFGLGVVVADLVPAAAPEPGDGAAAPLAPLAPLAPTAGRATGRRVRFVLDL